jgi:hypothetical protein
VQLLEAQRRSQERLEFCSLKFPFNNIYKNLTS